MYIRMFFYLMAIFALTGCGLLPAAAAPAATATIPARPADTGVVVVEGVIVPRESVRVITRTGGRLAEVLVQKGERVEKDAPLLRFDEREQAEAALAAARLEQVQAQQALDRLDENAGLSLAQAREALTAASRQLIEAEQRLDDLDNDTYQTNLDTYISDVGKAQDALEDAQKEWDKYKEMDPANQTRKDQKRRFDDAQKKYDDALRKRDLHRNALEQVRAEVEMARSAVDDAQRAVDKHQDGPHADDLLLARQRLENAAAQVSAAQSALNDLELKAPIAGTVVELDLIPGETLMPNQQALLLADLEELYVETSDLTELDVVKVSEGQRALVRPDALEDEDVQLSATVTEIARSAGKKGGDVIYTVRLKLDESDARLRWGMTVEVRFERP